jgi:hypothetical protein
MTKKFFILLASILIFSFLQMDCKDDSPVVPPVNPLQIAIYDVTCTEASLKLSLDGSETNRIVVLKRGDSIIATISMLESDSLFVDAGLLPKQTYTYSLVKDSWSVIVQATTQDTTSHDVQWQIPDTLGTWGLIRDVWVFSRDNAWAVGEIYLADSAGNTDMGNPYNAAHWDGSKWEIMQVPTAGFVGSGFYPLYTIFAFAPNNIWTFSGAGSYSHWNVQIWTTAYVAERQGGGQKLWGTSSSNLFLVGTNGSISRHNGSSWTKMESNTTVDLQDIWGIDDTHIWATGTNINDGRSVVSQYDGNRWTTIYDNANKPPNEYYGFRTLWTDRADNIFLAGGSRTQLMHLKSHTFQQQNISAEWVALQIRGRNRRDIFEARDGSEVLHFNGVNWHRYSQIKTPNSGNSTFTSVHPIQDFIVIGGFYFSELNGLPIVMRGYR